MKPDYDIAVVGCGPVGAYAANLLGRTGLKTVVLERDLSPYPLPRAVHIDHEIVRLLADISLWEPLRHKTMAADGHIHIGADGGVIRYLSAVNRPMPFGYANDYFFYQPELEEVLREGLERFDNVETRFGTHVSTLTHEADGVTITFADDTHLKASWVVGCDGARSTVRNASGIILDDLKFDEPWLVVDAEVDGPITFPNFTGVPEEANLQRLSVMLCDPRRPATIVPGRGNHRRWEFMLLPGEDRPSMEDPKRVRDLVAPWVQDTPHKIMRAATYRFHGLVAEQWRQGRIFLAGDAAHQTPPFFGQGMCHGMRDVANLVWKLAMVASGGAGAGLLDTYQTERDAQVRHVIGKAVDVGRTICVLDPEEAAKRDVRVRSEVKMQAAQELIVPIGSEVIGENAGERFINPPVDDGLLDDRTGGGWVLLSKKPVSLSEPAHAVLDRLGAVQLCTEEVNDRENHLAVWFDKKGVDAVLIRPDFYLAIAASSQSLCTDIMRLAEAMQLSPKDQPITINRGHATI
ncbi:bifunctional 3-(3-hydroxy-phenyl)propionate/3-hydroxycinnamic acid hydroxylase [Halomonas sp. BL6]|uniref:bifunctional 3-(3-hydroxy-phenyl)propionate/3-hydroxycinnamic acid hydroxylase MhpA n=1 Tax=Halomonas sp. BL6 TaxID=2585770 RepID=UPI0011188EF6|nr:bifunctional 3-(3-hydroxy-phenyl)propionate/3-hydroxycinnamic acid hydroxylase [Halomonas sp. BL6]TNH14114.1 bifunctional 3-(3-hydroxy-phenyl)propionate/3-hydroxycinnamic acid hydroxylase [Halomonas sp. BL6]